VNETWGALLGTYQAHRTRDPQIAAVFGEIAEDERRHATLSWRVAAWLDAHLTPDERANVGDAFRAAIAALRDEQAWPRFATVAHAAGLPDPATSLALLAELDAAVWAAA
jgi:rubrerythrin